MNFLFTLVLIAASALSTQAISGFRPGKCLNIPTIKDIDFTQYVGDWYEIERFNSIFERNLKCCMANYQFINASSIIVENTGINSITGATANVKGIATAVTLEEPNKLNLVLPIQVGGVTLFENEGMYNVWDTDYESYALVYSCQPIIPGILKSEVAWILAREKSLPDVTIQYLKGVLETEGLDLSQFEIVNQTDC